MLPRLAAFDMDGTLISGRLVFALADRFGLSDKIRVIQSSGLAGYEQTKAIAAVFEGLTKKDVESAIESIPLIKNCEATITTFRDKGYKTGIISDSYTIAAGSLADRLNLDFMAANELEIENGMLTGKVRMPLGWDVIGCFCKISVCKRYHLEKFARQFNVPLENAVAIGDTKSDICMIKRAGVGIVFMPKDKEIEMASDKIVFEADLSKVLVFAR